MRTLLDIGGHDGTAVAPRVVRSGRRWAQGSAEGIASRDGVVRGLQPARGR